MKLNQSVDIQSSPRPKAGLRKSILPNAVGRHPCLANMVKVLRQRILAGEEISGNGLANSCGASICKYCTSAAPSHLLASKRLSSRVGFSDGKQSPLRPRTKDLVLARGLDPIITKPEFAALLGISRATLDRERCRNPETFPKPVRILGAADRLAHVRDTGLYRWREAKCVNAKKPVSGTGGLRFCLVSCCVLARRGCRPYAARSGLRAAGPLF